MLAKSQVYEYLNMLQRLFISSKLLLEGTPGICDSLMLVPTPQALATNQGTQMIVRKRAYLMVAIVLAARVASLARDAHKVHWVPEPKMSTEITLLSTSLHTLDRAVECPGNGCISIIH